MEDLTQRIFQDHLVRNPDFAFLDAIRDPRLADYAQELEWWYHAFRWQLNCVQKWLRDNDRYFDDVAPGGTILSLHDPAVARGFAAERARSFVRNTAELLEHGALYFDEKDNLACRYGNAH